MTNPTSFSADANLASLRVEFGLDDRSGFVRDPEGPFDPDDPGVGAGPGGVSGGADDGNGLTFITIDTPLEYNDQAESVLQQAPAAHLPAPAAMTQALANGMIANNIADGARSGSYARLCNIPVEVSRAEAKYRPNQVEEHLQVCLLAFERIQRDRANWAELIEKAFYVETELMQFVENEKVYAEEVDYGLYSNAYTQAFHEAEAARVEAHYAAQVAMQVQYAMDRKFENASNEVTAESVMAWLSTLSTYKETREQDEMSLGSLPFFVGAARGKKPELAQLMAATTTRWASDFAILMGRAEQLARTSESEAKSEQFQSALNRMDWELANGAFRRQRADIARAASFAKAAAYIDPNGALNFNAQINAIEVRMARDAAEVIGRSKAIELGLKQFYGLDAPRPSEVTQIETINTATLNQLDATYLWLRDCAAELDRFKQFEQSYVLPVSLRQAIGEAAWASRHMPGFWTFKLPIHPWFDGESHFRVRGVRAYAYGVAPEDGFWDIRFHLPEEGVVRGLHGEISVVNQIDLPEVRLPRVGARDQREPVEFVGVSALANASPIGSENGTAGNCWIAIQSQSSQRVPTSKITDIELEFAIASRRWLT